MAELTYEPQPHPYLHEPRIFVSGLPLWITDQHLASALQACAPFRPNIIRDPTQPLAAGTIEFRYLEKAEKALATLHDRSIPDVTPSVILNLSPFPYTIPPTPLPPPAALPRLVKHLPMGYNDSMIYDIFRPYGALANVRTGITGPDSALIQYWREEDASVASETLHCADIGGANIAIQLYQPRRAPGPQPPELHPNAPSFVPTGGGFSYPNAQYSPSPPRGSPFSRGQLPFVHGPGQQVQPAPPGTSHSGLIDPCNLFCKNLDPEIDSNGLFSHFRRFGQIVSARVMRNDVGESRGFGFVSFQQPEQANAALAAMNGAMLGTKAIVVRLHEPKQFRQEKLAARFQGNGHPRSASGATSPTLSVDGDSSFGGGNWNSPRHVSSPLASPHSGNGNFQERHIRRASGSYYTAALNGTLSVPLDYDGLASLSPVMRREILTGELSKRLRALDGGIPDIDTVVEDLINLALSDVVQGLADNTRLAEQVASVQQQRQQQQEQQQQAEQPTASAAEAEGASGTVTAPEHPSTPVSLGPSLATPPRTASPAGSIAPQGTERERMAAAITKVAPGQSDALTDLLMSLPKKERAQCLFNPERLRMKVGEAQAILEADDEDEEGPSSATTSAPTPATPVSKPAQTPATPELSRAPSAAASPMPATPSASTTVATETPTAEAAAYTLVSLARLPAVEIVRLASAGAVTGVPLPKADATVVASTDKFIDDMRDKPVQSQKQALGDKLFRVVKAFGIKGAPKLTIKLLDSEDLRALAHLMNSYPSVLKEKALLVQGETK